MATDNKIRQRTCLFLGTAFAVASIPLILLEASFGGWFVAVSAACYLLLPWTAFLRPRERWTEGLVCGFFALLVYGLCLPLWGRSMAPEDGSDDWRVFILLGIVVLNIFVPVVRRYAGPKQIT